MGVLCALPEELRLFRTEVADARVEVHGGIEVILGTLGGIAVALAETGLGKVNAAATATLLCDRYECDRILLSGVVGALDPSRAAATASGGRWATTSRRARGARARGARL
jgi:adenosylhomocysteine nucleosidase